jgi:hypothetical protein
MARDHKQAKCHNSPYPNRMWPVMGGNQPQIGGDFPTENSVSLTSLLLGPVGNWQGKIRRIYREEKYHEVREQEQRTDALNP